MVIYLFYTGINYKQLSKIEIHTLKYNFELVSAL